MHLSIPFHFLYHFYLQSSLSHHHLHAIPSCQFIMSGVFKVAFGKVNRVLMVYYIKPFLLSLLRFPCGQQNHE